MGMKCVSMKAAKSARSAIILTVGQYAELEHEVQEVSQNAFGFLATAPAIRSMESANESMMPLMSGVNAFITCANAPAIAVIADSTCGSLNALRMASRMP